MKYILLLLSSFFSVNTENYKPVPVAGNIHPVQASDKAVNMNGALIIAPGDTVFIDSAQGPLGRWSFSNCHGAEGDSVVFINYGGRANFTANNTGDNGMYFHNCTYFKVVSAVEGEYGFYVAGAGSGYKHGVACQVDGRSAHFDISGIDARDKASLFWVKQEQDCADSLSFPNWMITGFRLHHCRGRNLNVEGCYIISTGAADAGRHVTCNGITYGIDTKQQLRGGNCEIDHLDIDSTGRANVQVTMLETGPNKIHDNILKHPGFEFNNSQGNCISVGNGTRDMEIYNNITVGAYTNNIQINANGLVNIHNNNFGSSGNLYGHIPTSNGVPQNYSGALVRSFNYNPKTPGLGGSYLFRFIFKDNTWGTATSGKDIEIQDAGSHQYDVNNIICNSGSYVLGFGAAVDINTACANVSPVSQAGNDQTVTLPASVTLTGGGTDADGTITTYAWRQLSGPVSYIIATPASSTTSVTNLVPGAYVFRLTVTDNIGDIGFDDISVTVNAAANLSPVVNAGTDIETTAPNNRVTVTAIAADPDGVIVAYLWTKISGDASVTIKNSTLATTDIYHLLRGTYVFRCTVTDNTGAKTFDDITITKKGAGQ